MPTRFRIVILGSILFVWLASNAGAAGLPQAGKDIKKAVDATEDATTNAGKTTGHAVKKESKVAGEKTEHAVDVTSQAVKKGAAHTGSAVKKDTKVAVAKTENAGAAAGHAAGHAATKGAKATGHAVKKTTDAVKDTFK
jgi:hypothetical protein